MSGQRRSTRVAMANKPGTQKNTYDSDLNSKFSIQEKQLILEALKKYPVDCLQHIQKEYLPKRKVAEIDLFIKRMKIKAKESRLRDIDVPHKAPIERWLQIAEDLTYHDFDYSYTLSQVLSIAGNLEPHDGKCGVQHPNWAKLYRYIVALLRGDHPPELGAVESAVMLDLIQSLADQLKQMETSSQRELMIRKFKLLTANVDINNKEASYAAARRALEEDLLESNPLGDATTSSPATGQATSDSSSEQMPRLPKKRGRKRKGEEQAVDPRPAKTSLYSINPFCIPVKYLKLKPKTVSSSNSHPQAATSSVPQTPPSSVPQTPPSSIPQTPTSSVPQTPTSSVRTQMSSPEVGEVDYHCFQPQASPVHVSTQQIGTPGLQKQILPGPVSSVQPTSQCVVQSAHSGLPTQSVPLRTHTASSGLKNASASQTVAQCTNAAPILPQHGRASHIVSQPQHIKHTVPPLAQTGQTVLHPEHREKTSTKHGQTGLAVPQRGTKRTVQKANPRQTPTRAALSKSSTIHAPLTPQPPKKVAKKTRSPPPATNQQVTPKQPLPMPNVNVSQPEIHGQSSTTYSSPEPIASADNVTRRIIITESASGTTTINIPTSF